MKAITLRYASCALLLIPMLLVTTLDVHPQRRGLPVEPLGDGPWEFVTAEQSMRIKVSIVTKGLSHPWGMAFMPNGDILVTERRGQLRIIRDGALDLSPISGVPEVRAVGLAGLMDIELHPEFSNNQIVYLTYIKNLNQNPLEVATTLAQGRLVNDRLEEVQDIFVSDSWPGNGGNASRIVFDADGHLFMTTGGTNGNASQDPSNTRGKVLRLTDDGSPAPGNPFEGRNGYAPEVYTMGHRNHLGLAFNPDTGEIWNSEMGPNGGDEINIIEPGANYGWPDISFGRRYDGPYQSPIPWREGITLPVAYFVPGISPSGLSFYSGDELAPWKNSVFTGSLRVGQIQGTGHLVRIFFDENGNERRRESLLTQLNQRIRDVKEGPDGYLYVLTEEDDAALLKIERAD